MLPFVTGICAVVEVMLFLSLLPLLLFAKRNHHYIYNYKSTFWLPFVRYVYAEVEAMFFLGILPLL